MHTPCSLLQRQSLLDMLDIRTLMRRLWQKTFPPHRSDIDQSRRSSCTCRRHRRCKPARQGRYSRHYTYKTRPSTLQVLNWLYWSSPDTTDMNSQRWHRCLSSTCRRHTTSSRPSLARSCSCPARTCRSRRLLAVPCSRRCSCMRSCQVRNLNWTCTPHMTSLPLLQCW